MRKDALLLLFSFSFTSGVLAQGDVQEDLGLVFGGEEYIEIATGTKQLISKAPAVASVITAEDIKNSGARTLDEVLASVPGFYKSLSSIRFSPIYSIRGIYTDTNPQILVLLDGVPMTNGQLGDRGALSSMPVQFVERVEVIRGPGSAIYGADAFAGVINIITKTRSNIGRAEVGASVGSFESIEGWGLYGGGVGDFNFAFGIQYNQTEGDDDRIVDSDAQTIFDNAINIPNAVPPASLAPGPANTNGKRLDTNFNLESEHYRVNWWSRHLRDTGVGPGLAQSLDPTGSGDVDEIIADALYRHKPSESWDLSYQLALHWVDADSSQKLFPPGTILPIGSDGNIDTRPGAIVQPIAFPEGFIGNPGVEEQAYKFEVVAITRALKDQTIRLAGGIDYIEVKGTESKNFGPGVLSPPVNPPVVSGQTTDVTGTDDVYLPEESRRIIYASFQDEVSLAANLDLTAGVRVDDYSDFGTTVNPRLALVWQNNPVLTTKFLYGRAFRAPSFSELYNQNNPVQLGNPDLEPEIINSFEVAFLIEPNSDLDLGVNLYAFRIDDFIEFVPDTEGRTAENVGEFNGSGLEFEASYQITHRALLSGYYAYQQVEDRQTGDPLPNAPQNQVYLQFDYRLGHGWLLDTRAKYIADRPRAAGDPRPELDDYAWVDLTIRKNVERHGLEYGFGVKNLFDEDAFAPSPYEPGTPEGALIPGDYPLEGRYLFGEVRYRF
jgi:outer membrane receptor protein involved in Fe transport